MAYSLYLFEVEKIVLSGVIVSHHLFLSVLRHTAVNYHL